MKLKTPRKSEVIRCVICSVEFVRLKKRIAAVIRKSGVWRCKPCATAIKNKAAARAFGSTRVHAKSGYVEEKTDHGWVRQHRAVMERHLGRTLNDDEIVHHINGNKQDNQLENLEIMLHGEHTVHHHHGAKRSQITCRRISENRRGIPNPQKLTTEEVIAIREAYAIGGTSYRLLAEQYGVSERAIAVVVKRIHWRHV
jgi:hypothetical protein